MSPATRLDALLENAVKYTEAGDPIELEARAEEGAELELGAWVRDALLLALPSQLLGREGCRGLCPVCGADLISLHRTLAHLGPVSMTFVRLEDLPLQTRPAVFHCRVLRGPLGPAAFET